MRRIFLSLALGLTLLGSSGLGYAAGDNPSDPSYKNANAPAAGSKDESGMKFLSGICEDGMQGSGIDLFKKFFECVWPWIVSVAGGVAVLNGVIGGTMVMFAGDDSGLRSLGLGKIKYSIFGLVLIAFIGVILRILNPEFYK